MSDTDQLHVLGQQLADALTASYAPTAPGAHLVFLAGGASVPDDIVQTGIVNPVQMQTWLSMNFDCPFVMSADEYALFGKDASHGSVSSIYTVAATTAQPLGKPEDDAWKQVAGQIADAQRTLGPTDVQKPIICEPDDWILPAATGYWTNFDSSQVQGTSSGPVGTSIPPDPAPEIGGLGVHGVPTVNREFWMIRSLTADTVSPVPSPPPEGPPPVIQASGPAEISRPLRSVFMTNRVSMPARISGGAMASTMVASTVVEAPMQTVQAAPASMQQSMPAIAASPTLATYRLAADRGELAPISSAALFESAAPITTVTTTSTSTITVHLEHQCVTLGYYSSGQSWWNGVFIANTAWYVPGMSRGGLLPSPDPTNDQIRYGLPMALIVVRNLKVSGVWSAQATAALSSTGGTLGPLSLFGAAVTHEADGMTVTYSHDGMQVIALLCSDLPVLPPVDAPVASPVALAS
jgi:hypothetical protein